MPLYVILLKHIPLSDVWLFNSACWILATIN